MGKLNLDKILKRVDLLQKMRQSFLSLSYLDAVASLAAARVEEATESDEEEVDVRVKIAKLPSDIKISDVARRYITGKKRKIDVVGPVSIGVRAEIAEA